MSPFNRRKVFKETTVNNTQGSVSTRSNMLQEQHSEHQQTITPLSNIPASALPAPSGIPMKKSSIPSAGSALPVFSTPKRQIGQLTQPKVIYSHNQSQQSLSASSQLYSNDTKTSGNLFNIDNLYTIH